MNALRLVGYALGLSALALAGAGSKGHAADSPQGQAPAKLVNARVTVRGAGRDMTGTFGSIVASQQTPGWIGYQVPATPGDHRSCDYMNGVAGRTYLEGRTETHLQGADERRVALEAAARMFVLYRVRDAAVHRVRVFSDDCEIDAGGLPVVWLTDVDPDQSVALLAGLVKAEPESDRRYSRGSDRPFSPDQPLTAIALHGTPAATRSLNTFVAAGQPLSIRKRAAFWLGASRGREGFDSLQRLVDAKDEDSAFRRELVFPISISDEAGALDLLLKMAKGDSSREVRQQALFWVGQKAGAKAGAFLSDVVRSDPDTELKKRAVFSLSQLPKDEGVPRLIDVARTNSNPEVRKQAMFWLGQSGDPRALSFFEEVLKK